MPQKSMSYIIIDWSPVIPYSKIKSYEHDYLESEGFYIIFTSKYDKNLGKYVDKKLQYIGQAYDQYIWERIVQEHEAADDIISKFLSRNPEYKLFVQVGVIIENSYKKTRQLFNDIEAFLIFDNQPKANTLLRENNHCHRNIIIINDGSNELLKKFSYRYD